MKRRHSVKGFGLAAMGIMTYVCVSRAVTIHVDAGNTAGPWDGSAAFPFATITNAANALAATNALVQGGHEIRVAPGTYEGRVDFTSSHSGLTNAANVLRAPERATCTADTFVFYLNNADYFVIDGFDFTGTYYPSGGNDVYGAAVYLTGTPASNRVQNCTFFANMKNGIGIRASNTARLKAYIEHCTFYGNLFGGIAVYAWNDIHVKNCAFVGNNRLGINNRHPATSQFYLDNNLFYGNGFANYGGDHEGMFILNTAGEINNYANSMSNIVANPGWSDLAGNWNFNRVYTNSPLLGRGVGGADIGTFQNPPRDPVSDATYYVDATLGDDSRSASEARIPTSPWASLTNAAAHAVAGDTVIVAAGNYGGGTLLARSGSEGKPLVFRADGEAVLSGGAYGFKLDRVIDVVLDGFTVTGASTAGILLSQSVMGVLSNVTAHSNPGAGLYMADRSCRNDIFGGRVYGNNAHGIRMSDAGNSIIRDTRIHQNTGASAGVHLHLSGQVWFWNCEMYGNAQQGLWQKGWLDYRPNTRLRHCTVYTNGTTGVHVDYWSTGSAENTIIAGNPTYGMYWKQSGLSYMATTYSAFHGNGVNLYRDKNFDPQEIDSEEDLNAQTGWSNVIVAKPGFRDATAFDLRLSADSFLIDRGTPTAEIDFDLYGNPRRVGAAVDIGAYESALFGGTLIMVR